MPTKEELELLQSELYAIYLAAGWHLKKRSVSQLTNLLHSELSEAMEGNRSNLMDNKLPHYKMEVVEVADFVIRALNWMSDMGHTTVELSCESDIGQCIELSSSMDINEMDFMDYLAELHDCMSYNRAVLLQIQKGQRTGHHHVNSFWLWMAVSICFLIADKYGWDLMAVIREKNAFNSTRPDHTLEERAKEHGKQY